MMNIHTLVFVCSTIFAFSKDFVNAVRCIETLATYKIVKSCPHNVKEWKEAVARKGCKKMTHQCYSFEYHCVINGWGNETVEVCAPRVWIVGKVCAEYYQAGRHIQRNENVICKKCPPAYLSNESYKYKECYEYVTNAKMLQVSGAHLTTTQKTLSSSSKIRNLEMSIWDLFPFSK